MKIVDVTPQNVNEETLFCIKDIKREGFKSKKNWFNERFLEGLRIKILKLDEKMVGFIEYTPANQAWRPIEASNFMFIHCITVYSKKDRNQGFGALLIDQALQEAKSLGMFGVCTMTSKGSWVAEKSLFLQNGFQVVEKRGRFELLLIKWDDNAPNPKLIDWTANQSQYQGWNLVYTDQCPWHEKSVFDLLNTAMDFGIELKIKKLETVQEAKQAPSGFGVFSLLHNGKLLEDHYISATRFKNILKKELKK